MTIPLAHLALAAALAAEPAGSPRAPAGEASPPARQVPTGGARNWDEPPPSGSPEDRALWRRLHDGGNEALSVLQRLALATHQLRWGKYYEALDETARNAGEDVAARAKALRARLEAAARTVEAATPPKLRVRICKDTLISFDQHLDFPDEPQMRRDMEQVRAEAKECADHVELVARALAGPADAFEEALKAVDVGLGRAAPAPPPGARPSPIAEVPR